MPIVDLIVKCDISESIRARQVQSLFDVPEKKTSEIVWKGDFPFDSEDWFVGLIVGPSGCGKTSIAKDIFGNKYHPSFEWNQKSVLDDIRSDISVETIASSFSSVGFNTIPAWLRPYHVLSNGEKFRVDVARRLLELQDPIVVDEFTSVVDRQVAQIGSHAVQKFVRKNKRKFVAVSCHYDIMDWLQPDWIFEPSTMSFSRRLLRRRPELRIEISRVSYETWRIFAPFHYLTAELSKAATCFALFVEGRIAAFTGVLHFPHPKVKNIKRNSRTVTLPDWQGLGLSFILNETLGAAYSACGFRFRNYPAHPSFIRAHMISGKWACMHKPGTYWSFRGTTFTIDSLRRQGSRPCAVFEYVGPKMDISEAKAFIHA